MKTFMTTRFSVSDSVYIINDDFIRRVKIKSINIKVDRTGMSTMYQLEEYGDISENRLYSTKRQAIAALIKRVCMNNDYEAEKIILRKAV